MEDVFESLPASITTRQNRFSVLSFAHYCHLPYLAKSSSSFSFSSLIIIFLPCRRLFFNFLLEFRSYYLSPISLSRPSTQSAFYSCFSLVPTLCFRCIRTEKEGSQCLHRGRSYGKEGLVIESFAESCLCAYLLHPQTCRKRTGEAENGSDRLRDGERKRVTDRQTQRETMREIHVKREGGKYIYIERIAVYVCKFHFHHSSLFINQYFFHYLFSYRYFAFDVCFYHSLSSTT